MYEFGIFLEETVSTLNQLRQALMLMVSTYLQSLASDETDMEVESGDSHVDLSLCLQMICCCRDIMKEIETKEGNSNALDEARSTLLKLEVACMAHLETSSLVTRIKEILSQNEPYSLYLELYYILEQEQCKQGEPKRECLRKALQVLLQQPSFEIETVLEIIHGLVDASDSKAEEYHWVEQLLQIAKLNNDTHLTEE